MSDRETLEARATELGVKFSSRTKDATLESRIAEAEAESEPQQNTQPIEGTAKVDADHGKEPPAGEPTSPAPLQSAPAPPAPVQPVPTGVLRVIGPKKGRYRAGYHFTPEPVDLPLADLSDVTLAAIKNDPALITKDLPET